jgi:hypothetical protein
MPDVLLAYSVAALLVAIVFVIAFLLGLSMRGAPVKTRVVLNLIAGVILATALLEKAGWSARHWSLGSPADEFNNLLFRVLLLVGFGLLFVSRTAALGNREP